MLPLQYIFTNVYIHLPRYIPRLLNMSTNTHLYLCRVFTVSLPCLTQPYVSSGSHNNPYNFILGVAVAATIFYVRNQYSSLYTQENLPSNHLSILDNFTIEPWVLYTALKVLLPLRIEFLLLCYACNVLQEVVDFLFRLFHVPWCLSVTTSFETD